MMMMTLGLAAVLALFFMAGVGASGASGNEPTIEVLHTLEVPGSGAAGALVADTAGNLYGMTRVGGRWDHGTVYKCTPEGVMTTLHHFYTLRGVGRLCVASDGWL